MGKLMIALILITGLAVSTYAGDVPGYILDEIKDAAAAEWPDKYSMQKYTIENEVSAWEWIDEYDNSDIDYGTLEEIKEKAASEWPGKYGMQKYTIENEVKAYLEIQ